MKNLHCQRQDKDSFEVIPQLPLIPFFSSCSAVNPSSAHHSHGGGIAASADSRRNRRTPKAGHRSRSHYGRAAHHSGEWHGSPIARRGGGGGHIYADPAGAPGHRPPASRSAQRQDHQHRWVWWTRSVEPHPLLIALEKTKDSTFKNYKLYHFFCLSLCTRWRPGQEAAATGRSPVRNESHKAHRDEPSGPGQELAGPSLGPAADGHSDQFRRVSCPKPMYIFLFPRLPILVDVFGCWIGMGSGSGSGRQYMILFLQTVADADLAVHHSAPGGGPADPGPAQGEPRPGRLTQWPAPAPPAAAHHRQRTESDLTDPHLHNGSRGGSSDASGRRERDTYVVCVVDANFSM